MNEQKHHFCFTYKHKGNNAKDSGVLSTLWEHNGDVTVRVRCTTRWSDVCRLQNEHRKANIHHLTHLDISVW